MTETAGAGSEGVARLDELAAVTREYSECARAAFGAASVAGGAITFAALALDLVGRWRWAQVAYLGIPALSLLAAVAARAHYQRHGAVLETAGPLAPRARAWMVTFVVVLAASASAAIALRAMAVAMVEPALAPMAAVSIGAAALASAATPALFAGVVRSKADLGKVIALQSAGIGMMLTARPPLPLEGLDTARLEQVYGALHTLCGVFFALVALIMVGQGMAEHARYRRLERRLAALRSPPA